MSITLWETFRATALVDYSYQVEISHRIFSGQMPYRDFMLVLTPGVYFLMAMVMKITGGYTHIGVVVQSLVVSALTALVSYVIYVRLSKNWLISVLLSAFITFTGQQIIVFPNYDVWTTLCILFTILVITFSFTTSTPLKIGFSIGMFSASAFLFKQSMGMPFSVTLLFFVIIITGFRRNNHWVRLTLGTLIGQILVYGLFGFWLFYNGIIEAFFHQTLVYPGGIREPSSLVLTMITDYQKASVIIFPITLGIVVASGLSIIFHRFRTTKNLFLGFSIFLNTLASIYWCAILFLFVKYFQENYNNGLVFIWTSWQSVFLVALGIEGYLILLKKRAIENLWLPIIVFVAIQFGLLSHTIPGSHYGVWPLLGVLISWSYPVLRRKIPRGALHVFFIPGIIACLICLSWYVYSSKFIYANISEIVTTSKQVPIIGLSAPRHWIPAFESLLDDIKNRIPMDDRVAFLPGEDPFFAATNRQNYLWCSQWNATTCDTYGITLESEIIAKDIQWIILKYQVMSPFAYVGLENIPIDLHFVKQTDIADTYAIYRRSK